jgi:flagellar biosynthetic protein FlhB
MAEDLGDKTEMPTSRRRREARGRGQIAKSQDFGSAVDLAGGFIALLLLGGSIVGGLTALLRYVLDDRTSGAAMDPASLDGVLRLAAVQLAVITGPFLLVMFAISYFAQFMQVGWLFTLQPLQPKLSRLNPVTGLSRLFSRRNAVKTAVGAAKMIVIGAVGIIVVRSHMAEIAALPRLTAAAAFMVTGQIIADMCIWMLAIMLIIGITDFIYQRWQHTKDLKMTKQEIKDEFRSMEGDVETKGRRLRMARQIALQRVKQAVPKADVVVTNPTHFAVALQYDPENMAAPKVVAKGADFMAFRIREIAAASGIPIVEKPPLARALYAEVDIGRSISPEFYEAVAEILAYVYRLQGKQGAAA